MIAGAAARTWQSASGADPSTTRTVCPLDGGVVIQYNCECPELVDKLRTIVRGYDKHVIVAPYPGMKSRIALTAWTRLDRFEEFDEKRIVRFIEAYRGIDHHKR